MTNSKKIPDGYSTVTAHLVCRNAAQAIEYYKKAFGAEERMRMAGPTGGIMYAELRIGNSTVMLGDENLDFECLSPLTLNGTPVTLHVFVEDVDKAFDRAIQAGAKVKMPVTDMFWGDRYGQLVDPFGHVWALATHMKDMTPDEMQKAAAAFFASGAMGKAKTAKAK